MNPFEFVMRDLHHFNAGALKRALIDWYKLVVKQEGKMFLAMAGAMSSGRLGIVVAEAIRRGLVHGMSVTGANLEESLFRLVADKHYLMFPNYRFHSLADETQILNQDMRRVTDLSIPEDEAFRKVEKFLVPMWNKAHQEEKQRFWHEFFYELMLQDELREQFQGNPEECWLLEAAKARLPLIAGGFADSTFGNIFAAHCVTTGCNPGIVASDIQQFMRFYDTYRSFSLGRGVGFFQIGGGIAGDFPICIVPSMIYDLKEKDVKPWAYFCQISDSPTSYGGYSGATPNEKITWNKLTAETPMYVVESDATIVFPIMMEALFCAQDNPEMADKLIAEYEEEMKRRAVQV